MEMKGSEAPPSFWGPDTRLVTTLYGGAFGGLILVSDLILDLTDKGSILRSNALHVHEQMRATALHISKPQTPQAAYVLHAVDRNSCPKSKSGALDTWQLSSAGDTA